MHRPHCCSSVKLVRHQTCQTRALADARKAEAGVCSVFGSSRRCHINNSFQQRDVRLSSCLRGMTSGAPQAHTGRSDVTQSMFTMRSPFCEYNTVQFVELKGKDLSCYSNKIDSVGLRKWPYDHRLTKKMYLSDITVTNISPSFTHKMVAKNQLAQIWNEITSLSPCVYCRRTARYHINYGNDENELSFYSMLIAQVSS